MTTGAVTPHRSPVAPERESLWYLVHAEWTKFRTVRGWVIAVLVTIVAITAFAFLGADVGGGCVAAGAARAAACPAQPTGPGGEPVVDAFYFAHQPVTGNGTITVQVTSLTGQVAVAPGGSVPDGPQMGPGRASAAGCCYVRQDRVTCVRLCAGPAADGRPDLPM